MPQYPSEQLETCAAWESLPLDHDEEELMLATNVATLRLAAFMGQEGRVSVTPVEIRVTGPQAEHPTECVVLAETRAVLVENYGGLHGSG